MINEPKLKKNLPLLIILLISAAAIYMLPYIRNFYYDAFRDAFGMTNEETGLAGTYFGLFGAASYLIGGLIADKISIKILIPGSMIVTGSLGFVLLLSPDPMIIAIIHGVWGITSLMTFWPALIKALRMIGNSNEQSRVFGIFEGGRGITNAVIYAVATMLFGAFYIVGDEMTGIRPIIILYSSITVILGFANIILLRKIQEKKSQGASGNINMKMIGSVLKNRSVWMISFIMLCTYTLNMSNYYIAPYATAAFSVSVLIAGIMSSSSQYIRPFAAIGAGFLGDRINASKVMLLGLLLSLVGLGIIYVTPIGSSIIPVLIGLMIVFATMFITQSMHFALMEETTFPKEATGTIIGICCTIGYLPEAFCPLVAGEILDANIENPIAGYRLIFVLLMGITVVGVALTLVWMQQTKVRRMELLEMRRTNKKCQMA